MDLAQHFAQRNEAQHIAFGIAPLLQHLHQAIGPGRAVLYPNQSSGVLRSASWADGLVEVLEHTTLAEGDSLRFIPFSELLG